MAINKIEINYLLLALWAIVVVGGYGTVRYMTREDTGR